MSDLLNTQPDGLAIDFTDTTYFNLATGSQSWNQKRVANVDTLSSPHTFYTNGGTSPKFVRTSATALGWSPHNMFLNSDAPATQNVTLVTGLTYTYGITGPGTLTGSSGASGAATAGNPVTFTATGTTGTFTVSGGTPTTMQLNRGSVLTTYLSTTAAIVNGLPISYGEGLLVEPTTINIAQRSQEFSNVFWALARASVLTGETAPDGTTTAFKLIEDNTATNTHRLDATSAIAITAAQPYTLSCYMKAGTRTDCRLQFSNTPDAINITINLATGTFVTGTGGAGMTFVGAGVEIIGLGWYRVWITGSSDTDTSAFLTVFLRFNNSNTYSGDGSSFIRIWGAQFEQTPALTSYIQTPGSATATRATDLPNVLTSAFPFSATHGTFVAWFAKRIADSTTADRILCLDDGTGNEVISYQNSTVDTPDAIALNMIDGGVLQVDPTVTHDGSVVTTGNKGAFWYATNDSGVIVDGGSEVVDTVCTLPTVTNLQLGYSADVASRSMNGFLQRMIYVPLRLPTVVMLSTIGTGSFPVDLPARGLCLSNFGYRTQMVGY